MLKAVIWMGSSKDDLIAFLRTRGGKQVISWKTSSVVMNRWTGSQCRASGPGVREIRIRESSGAFRVIYLATRPEGVYVLHCFQKKSQQTSRQDLALAKARFKAVPSAM